MCEVRSLTLISSSVKEGWCSLPPHLLRKWKDVAQGLAYRSRDQQVADLQTGIPSPTSVTCWVILWDLHLPCMGTLCWPIPPSPSILVSRSPLTQILLSQVRPTLFIVSLFLIWKSWSLYPYISVCWMSAERLAIPQSTVSFSFHSFLEHVFFSEMSLKHVSSWS